jgi:hypothetical protein
MAASINLSFSPKLMPLGFLRVMPIPAFLKHIPQSLNTSAWPVSGRDAMVLTKTTINPEFSGREYSTEVWGPGLKQNPERDI